MNEIDEHKRGTIMVIWQHFLDFVSAVPHTALFGLLADVLRTHGHMVYGFAPGSVQVTSYELVRAYFARVLFGQTVAVGHKARRAAKRAARRRRMRANQRLARQCEQAMEAAVLAEEREASK